MQKVLNMLSKVIMLVLAGVFVVSAGCAVNPVTGEEEMMFFSPESDVKLGRQYALPLEKELGGRIPDENLQRYINSVGQKIARVCDQPDISYHYTAVEDKMINAMALPGGYVFITRGLLNEIKTEGQLAAVLAHETGHVVARDTMQALSRQLGMTALLAATAVGAPGRVARGAGFISAMLSLQYSREDEAQADKTGLLYMTKAGYDPNGIVQVMEIFDKLQTERPIEFFSTHPNPESRITYLKEQIAAKYADSGPLKTGKEEYEEAVLSKLKRHRNMKPDTPDSPGTS